MSVTGTCDRADWVSGKVQSADRKRGISRNAPTIHHPNRGV